MAQKREFNIEQIDRPDLSETFADSVSNVSFDGQSWRIEFSVTRLEPLKGQVVSGKRFPTCRVALTPTAGVDLMRQLQEVAASMQKRGVLKAMPKPGEVAVSEASQKPN